MPSLTHRAHRSRRARRAFTLIELMIVVAIVGILGVLAVLGYRRYKATAHMAEATNLTSNIRAAQEAFKTEKGVYAAVSGDTSSFYPAAAPGSFVTQWGDDCKNCNGDLDGWKKLAVTPSGPVMFGYATVAGVGAGSYTGQGTPPKAQFTAPTPPEELKPTSPYFVTVAWGDTNADGTPCIVTAYSFSNQLVIQSAGE